jgi:predicted translin family RNA/ssDNA-binding protein
LASITYQPQHPSLRQGSFSNSLEEWAEGILTLEWAENKKILSMAELKIVNSTEYIGALSDFTGEIGRMAVASASRRDTDSVRDVLQADVTIAGALMQANTSGKYTRKTDAVLQNLKKVEDIVYELSMLKKGGRVKEREAEPRDCKDNGAEAADEN